MKRNGSSLRQTRTTYNSAKRPIKIGETDIIWWNSLGGKKQRREVALQPSCASVLVEPIPYNFAERCRKAPVPAGFRLNGVKKSSGALYQKLPDDMVEPRGVEPLSEDQTSRASPSAVCVFTFPPQGSRRQDPRFSSFIKSHRPQSLRRLVPCLYDADGLRRRRLRVDDRD